MRREQGGDRMWVLRHFFTPGTPKRLIRTTPKSAVTELPEVREV